VSTEQARRSSEATGGMIMAYVIAEPCISVKDKACVEVCPVDCIYEGPDQLFIHPDGASTVGPVSRSAQ